MKKRILIFLLCTASLVSAQSLPRFEAESGTNQFLVLLQDSAASGRQFLRMKDSGSVTWKVPAEKSGWFNLIVRFRAFGGEKEQLIIKNGRTIPTGFPISDQWTTLKRAVSLDKGENTISISKSWGYMDIDYLETEPVNLKPELVPIRNHVLSTQPRDLHFKWNAYGKKLNSVLLDGKKSELKTTVYPHQEDAYQSILEKEKLANLKSGSHTLQMIFDSADTLKSVFTVSQKPVTSPLVIVSPDVEHGSSVIIRLPTGKIMMVDTGKDWVRDQILIPFLQREKITKIDYLLITHYHDDHDSGDRGEKIRNLFQVDQFIDYSTYKTGTVLPFEGTSLKILNCSEDGTEENTKSLSFKLTYNGFSYTHGADTYGLNQQLMLDRFPDDTRTDVFMANHHFHGSVNVDYLRKLDPVLVLIQAQEAIYARSAFMLWFREETESWWRKSKSRYLESLPALEVGTTVIKVRTGQDWTYETHQSNENLELLK
ncbi:MAG: MBL fold metallo-hydrolase [Bacteroidetes bacterium]|nr:MBL fold metallo-hydrolase [Bacteroidota bacterium]